MKNYIVILILFVSFAALAQTGVGTQSPHPSAILDMDVSMLPNGQKKGFLLSRVSLNGANDASTVPNPQKGFMVFNTNQVNGANAVEANNVYIWNPTLSVWERYYSRDEINEIVPPADFYARALTNQLTNSGSTNINSNPVVVSWQSSDIVVLNNQVATLDANGVSFTIQQDGIFDISGFFNYSPDLSENSNTETTDSNQTDVVFILQKSTNNGSSWTSVNSVTYALGRGVGNTFTSIDFPSTTLHLNDGDKLRVIATRNFGGSPSSFTRLAHGSGAGIKANSGQAKKSIRISMVVGQ